MGSSAPSSKQDASTPRHGAESPSKASPGPLEVGAASLRQAVEGSTDCIKVLDLEGRLEYMNEGGMCAMEIEAFGPFQGACWPDLWRGEAHEKAQAALDAARAGGVGRFQGHTATAKGNVRFWDVTVSPVPGRDGNPEKLLSVSRDITAQREAEEDRERLQTELEAERARTAEANALLRLVTDRVPVRIAYIDRDYRFRFVNDAYLAQVGLSREAALGRTLAEALGEPMFLQARPNVDRALAGETHTQEFDALYDTGTRPIRATYVPDVTEGGEARGVVIQVLDLTAQRANEAARRASETRYRAIFDAIDEGFCVLGMVEDAEGRVVDYRFKAFNPAFEAQAGVPAEKARAGLTIRQIAPGIEASWIETYERVAATGESARFEMGSDVLGRYCEVYAFRLEDERNGDVGVLFKDVSERRAAERALTEARGRLDAVLAAAEVGLWGYDPATGTVEADVNLAAMFGFDQETARRSPISAFIQRVHPDDQARVAEAFDRAIAGGAPYEMEYRTVVDGRVRHLVARGFAERDEDGRVVRLPGAVIDVTELKRAQEGERTALETFRTVFEQAPDDAILVMDLDRTLTAWNPAAERILGWRAEEAVGQPADLIFTPEDRAAGAPGAETATAAREGRAEDERWHVRKDGSRLWGSGTMNALHDEGGAVRGFLKVFRDATARHLEALSTEERNQELEARVEERTQDLERAVREAEGFNYAISHDLRTPLRAIHMTSSILLEEAGPELSSGHRELLARQGRAASRLARLIDGLLGLSRLSRVALRRQTIDMTREARDAAAQAGCEVEVQEGMEAEGDSGLVLSVWQNLVGNACKFSPDGGTVRVGQEAGAFFVRDEGIGFDMAYASKVFLPFERLVADDEFPGTGIGLANVQRIVGRHGGRVWCESEPGKGSTFWFTLG